MLAQLKYTGILDTVRVRQAGFLIRQRFQDFAPLYVFPCNLLPAGFEVPAGTHVHAAAPAPAAGPEPPPNMTLMQRKAWERKHGARAGISVTPADTAPTPPPPGLSLMQRKAWERKHGAARVPAAPASAPCLGVQAGPTGEASPKHLAEVLRSSPHLAKAAIHALFADPQNRVPSAEVQFGKTMVCRRPPLSSLPPSSVNPHPQGQLKIFRQDQVFANNALRYLQDGTPADNDRCS